MFVCLLALTAVHCNLSQNGIDHQMRPEDMTSQLEEEEESVDAGGVLLDDDSPTYQDVSPPVYHRRSPPHRSVSESELTRPGYVKLSKPVALWTQQDVCKWLKKHCPNQHQIYSDSFKQHDITGGLHALEQNSRPQNGSSQNQPAASRPLRWEAMSLSSRKLAGPITTLVHGLWNHRHRHLLS
uniref:Sterile alpha motif domain containing 12 n=1 Tax=Scophthalmus maximus TaxID=52904 RepID=A0A8D3BFH0_SCOMX